MESGEVFARAHRAFCDDDPAALREILQRHPELRSRINDAEGAFDSPPIINVKSRPMLDLLLENGADINAKSRWWAGGFGLLHSAPPDVAKYAIERGANVDVHAAVRLGLMDRVRELVEADPSQVRARGGDGQTPLHFASTQPIAEYLLQKGADINARDIDHESTPAQWMLGDRQELARFLVSKGCATDLLMAAALGDFSLARKHLDSDAESIRVRVNEDYFPMTGAKAGGTIYQWVLGWHVSPHQVAKERGHSKLVDLLMDRSPLEVKLANAAWMHDRSTIEAILRQNPKIGSDLRPADRRQPAHAARNDDTEALRLLLLAGFPISSRGQHNATPLHWASWHGNAEAVQVLLPFKPDLEDKLNDFSSSPLGWAIHGSENGWHREKGNYPRTVELLFQAGVKPPDKLSGTPEVQEVIKRFSVAA